MDEVLFALLVFLSLIFLALFATFCIYVPFVGIPVFSLLVLCVILALIFPKLIHGKNVYSARVYSLSKENFEYYKGHSKHWNLNNSCFHSQNDKIYVQKTWNPFFCIEIISGKLIRIRTDSIIDEIFFAKTFFAKLTSISPITNVEEIEKYLSDTNRDMGDTLSNLEATSKKTYEEAKLKPKETARQIIQNKIRQYRQFH